MMNAITNRRALLGSIAFAAPVVVLAASGTVSAVPAATADRTAWDRAFAHMEKTRADYEAYQPIYRTADEGFERDKPTGDEINLRTIYPAIGFVPSQRYSLLHNIDLAEAHAQFIADEGKIWGASDPAATIAKHKSTCDQIAQFRHDFQAAKDRHNYDEVVERDEALSDAAYEARWALFDLPAPDLAALHWKIEHLFVLDRDADESATPWHPDIIATLMADVRRLMPQEA